MKKRLVLTFPAGQVDEPVTYTLIKQYDILVNILNADISPGREGKLLVELKGDKISLGKAIEYIESIGVHTDPVKKSILLREKDCVHCGSCTAVCFADALTMDPDSRRLVFRPEKCVACELCLKACPLNLFELSFHNV